MTYAMLFLFIYGGVFATLCAMRPEPAYLSIDYATKQSRQQMKELLHSYNRNWAIASLMWPILIPLIVIAALKDVYDFTPR